MKEITILCAGMTRISQFHDVLARALNFPEDYGANLDAMHDLLTALPEPTRLILPDLACADFPVLALQRVLRDSAQENPNLQLIW